MRWRFLMFAFVVLGVIFTSTQPARSSPSTTNPSTNATVIATTTPTTNPTVAATKPVAQNPAAVVVLKGVVDEYTRDTFLKRCNEAKANGAKTLIVVLNTPGGLVMAA